MRAAHLEAPSTLNDRAADNWEPLLAIADIAGGRWLERARAAAQALSGNQQADASIGVALLTDIRQLFLEMGEDRIASRDLVKKLVQMEGRPWAESRHGKEMSQSQLATLLRPFRIFPRSIRIGDKTPKGYFLDSFKDAFARYLPPSDPPQRHNPVEQGNNHDSACAVTSICGGSESCERDYENSTCGVVADGTPPGEQPKLQYHEE